MLPGHDGPARDDLHGPVEIVVHEPCAQTLVALDQRFHRPPEQRGVEGSFQVQV